MKRVKVTCLNYTSHCINFHSLSGIVLQQEMTNLFWFCIVFMISHVVEKTMSQQCPSERSISGWMLQRHVYKTMLAEIGLHCLLRCSTDDRCQSFNFVMSSHMCEFNDRTREARPEDFIPGPDRYYFKKRVNRGNLNITSLSPKNMLCIVK